MGLRSDLHIWCKDLGMVGWVRQGGVAVPHFSRRKVVLMTEWTGELDCGDVAFVHPIHHGRISKPEVQASRNTQHNDDDCRRRSYPTSPASLPVEDVGRQPHFICSGTARNIQGTQPGPLRLQNDVAFEQVARVKPNVFVGIPPRLNTRASFGLGPIGLKFLRPTLLMFLKRYAIYYFSRDIMPLLVSVDELTLLLDRDDLLKGSLPLISDALWTSFNPRLRKLNCRGTIEALQRILSPPLPYNFHPPRYLLPSPPPMVGESNREDSRLCCLYPMPRTIAIPSHPNTTHFHSSRIPSLLPS